MLESEIKINESKRERHRKEHAILEKGRLCQQYGNKLVEKMKTVLHCCGNYVNHCIYEVAESKRKAINYLKTTVLKIKDWQRQKAYITKYVVRDKTERKTRTHCRGNHFFHWFFAVNDAKTKACEAVYLKALELY